MTAAGDTRKKNDAVLLRRRILFGLLLALTAVSFSCRREGVSYRVNIRGEIDRCQRSSLREISNSVALRHQPPATNRLLRRRAELDLNRFRLWLRSEGYFDSRVELLFNSDRTPARVVFQVDPGPHFLLGPVEIELVDEDEKTLFDPPVLPGPEELGLKLGSRARFLDITHAQEKLERSLSSTGFAFARVMDRRLTVDHRNREVAVVYLLQSGPRVFFGPVSFQGSAGVRRDFLRGKLPWKEGALFDGKLLEEFHRRLASADLFSLVRVRFQPSPSPGELLPIEVELRERKPRSVGLGLAYNTDEGISGRISWIHRNLFRRGERLGFRATVSEIGYLLEGDFRKPDFLRYDQTLNLGARLAEEDTDAYLSRQAGGRVGIDRGLAPGVVAGLGVDFKYSRVRDNAVTKHFGLISTPARVSWDRSDDLLDPRQGWRLNLILAPFHDATGSDLQFLKSQLHFNRYFQIVRNFDFAVRLGAGAIGGAARDSLPADERFYAGGGGSVRGYAYQSAGTFLDGKPRGGRSFFLGGGELRARLAESWGLVFFLDGGTAYEESLPRWGENLFWGAGAGLRYFTPVGPLRLDLAFPLNHRREVDSSYQIYLSVGQAF